MKQLIFTDAARALQLTVSPVASAATVALLQQTTYGTHGPQYRHTGQAEKVARITGPHFFELWKGEELAGTYCLSRRLVPTPTGPVPGYYGRYLAVAAAHQGHGYGHLLKQEAVRYIERTQAGPHLFYSYVEGANARSLQIAAQAGFHALAQLEALAFGRLYPKLDPRFGQLPAAEQPAMRAWLAAAYQGHALVQLDHLFDEGNYFVLRENGEIIAGVQANPVRWRIVAMPGISGKFMLRVLPHVPVLKRLINPARHEFAALEALYVLPGREPALLALLESVLAHFGYTSALVMLDTTSPLHGYLKNSGKLGLLQALKQPTYSQVLVKLNGLAQAPAPPLYASAFDYT
ncbi:MAG TPA: GNAT family N-acetyltransferase [Hymenobacter sp.]|uniref:GNAT family N-acetyltransferase n=1 Tax=Hymenobacter sp. TaxID=1898978 RepID=UPI002D7E24A3|nr:GNAT family N-acetyltransferase [Hymenobacter sp.]HET9503870.1 GNAT family N-acetyltransferase [Hymenobacter sp.]